MKMLFAPYQPALSFTKRTLALVALRKWHPTYDSGVAPVLYFNNIGQAVAAWHGHSCRSLDVRIRTPRALPCH